MTGFILRPPQFTPSFHAAPPLNKHLRRNSQWLNLAPIDCVFTHQQILAANGSNATLDRRRELVEIFF
jgi:hypothetical protein